MALRVPFATPAEIEARHPRELGVLAADETTRQVDALRVTNALIDVSTEMRAILAARYAPALLDQVDEESAGVLRLFAIDMALYRVALSFSRQSEAIKARYDTAVKRLEGIAAGRGALTFAAGAGGNADAGPAGPIAPHEALIEAPERVFTRARFNGGRRARGGLHG